jgi:hypothetical protein
VFVGCLAASTALANDRRRSTHGPAVPRSAQHTMRLKLPARKG